MFPHTDELAPCPPSALWWARRASARLCPPYGAVLGRLLLRLHFGRVVVHQLLADLARRECPLRDLGDRRHLRGGARQEALGETVELIRHDAPLDHLDAAAPGEVHGGRSCDAG